MKFEIITVEELPDFLNQQSVYILDIRDESAFALGHIPDAIPASGEKLLSFIKNADRLKPVLCYCYKGISSQAAAQYLIEEGFKRVYSLSGGFDAWQEQVGGVV